MSGFDDPAIQHVGPVSWPMKMNPSPTETESVENMSKTPEPVAL
jgi:hypothetical protein